MLHYQHREGQCVGPFSTLLCVLGSQPASPTSVGCLPSSCWLGLVSEEPHRRLEGEGGQCTFPFSLWDRHRLLCTLTQGFSSVQPPRNLPTPSFGSFSHNFPHPFPPRGEMEAVSDFGIPHYSLFPTSCLPLGK